METPNNKPLIQSKTVVINALAAALVALEANTGVLQPLLPVNVYALIAGLLPVVNTVLRVVTTTGVSVPWQRGQ